MIRRIFPYFLVASLGILAVACRQAKYVPDEEYLLKKNTVQYEDEETDDFDFAADHPQVDEGGVEELIRPQPNVKIKLFFYNRIDTTKLNKQVERKKRKYQRKNDRRQAREDRINLRRIDRAEEKGESEYRHKVIPNKTVKKGWRHWFQTHLGQPPVLLDTGKVNKSKEQIRIYLKRKGFYQATVSDTVTYKKKKQKAIVNYYVDTGDPIVIKEFKLDSVSFNPTLFKAYSDLVKESDTLIKTGMLLDQDILDEERDRFSTYCRNEAAMFGFNRNYISYVVDTTIGTKEARVIMFVKPKIIKDPATLGLPDSLQDYIEVRHQTYRVKKVTFRLYNSDSTSFKDYQAYKDRVTALGYNSVYDEKMRYLLLDTMVIPGKGKFIYNEEPFIHPELLDRQNFLEIDSVYNPKGDDKRYYKEYYVERSYRTLSNLGVFSNISPNVYIDSADLTAGWVAVSYDLMPLKKQSFMVEPRLANTNGILGIQGRIAYTNRNLFGGAQQLELSFEGGMESQPLIVGTDNGGEVNGFQLNTFEWGPRISFTFPKLSPLPKKVQKGISKRAYPQTVVDLTVNFQQRTEFKRTLTELGYSWKFQQDKVQRWEVGIVKIDYVRLEKEDFFLERLENLNDPFVLNSYTDHLTTTFNPIYYYNNYASDTRKNILHSFTGDVDVSGWMLTPVIYEGLESSNFSGVSINDNGQREVFGVPYTQFIKFDFQYVNSYAFKRNKKHKIVSRYMAGMGFASGNSPSLPYEYAFFAGGSNDIRAFEARTMAPGSYKTYADTNATLTQIGDTRFEINLEWRFPMTPLLEGAIFTDMGNIWNLRKDTVSADDPTVLKLSSWREVAVGTGFGIRADFDFLIIRLDLAFPLHNPHLPAGERWLLQDKTEYKTYFEENPETGELIDYEHPHALRLNFGIGYPF